MANLTDMKALLGWVVEVPVVVLEGEAGVVGVLGVGDWGVAGGVGAEVGWAGEEAAWVAAEVVWEGGVGGGALLGRREGGAMRIQMKRVRQRCGKVKWLTRG